MAAILGLELSQVESVCEQASSEGVCSIANLNSPDQSVIAGSRAAVESAVDIASKEGARRALLLPGSAPFHCSLMAPAREAMRPLLEEVEFGDPQVPVICNVDARPVATGAEARDALIRQIRKSPDEDLEDNDHVF